jgi:thymidylate synthase (FAD)
MQKLIYDHYFRVVTIARTENPQQLIYRALRQDYSEGDVSDQRNFMKSEAEYGALCIKHLLQGGRGHFGPLEHPQITLNCIGFPHDVPMQARTHRVGISFDIQSSRYSGQRFIDVANGLNSVESVFYARPVGRYKDREGNDAEYTQDMRSEDLEFARASCLLYEKRVKNGVAPEAARQFVVQGFRQNFVLSFNLRSALHFLDLRSKADAQPEIQALSDKILVQCQEWSPEITEWYISNRLKKAALSP